MKKGRTINMTVRSDGRLMKRITVMERGRKVQKTFYGKTERELLQKIAAYETKALNGEKFEHVADDWWEDAAPQLAYNTQKPYKPALNRAREYFSSTPINDIKPADVQRFLARTAQKYKMSDKTCRTQLMVLNLIFRYAVSVGAAEINPTSEISVPKGLRKYKREMPLAEDIARVKANTHLEMGMFAYWIMYTGCRKGELLALTWKDVDVKNRTICIRRASYFENNHLQIKETKTRAGVRELPLMDKLLEKITPGKGIIFNVDGEYMSESHFRKAWDRYRRDSGVTCTPHQLRHAYATMLFEAGIDPKDAQRLLGHANLSTTQEIYTHIREDRVKKINDALLSVDIV